MTGEMTILERQLYDGSHCNSGAFMPSKIPAFLGKVIPLAKFSRLIQMQASHKESLPFDRHSTLNVQQLFISDVPS
jgi:hypothetical protein